MTTATQHPSPGSAPSPSTSRPSWLDTACNTRTRPASPYMADTSAARGQTAGNGGSPSIAATLPLSACVWLVLASTAGQAAPS